MTPLRKYRLLLLAKHGGDHKKYYSKYCELMSEGLVTWCLGMAFLTDKGNKWLKERGENSSITQRKALQ